MPVPAVGPEDAARIPPVFADLNDGEKRGIAAAYYTSVAYIDRNVGTSFAALDRSPDATYTLVISNSDRGYLLGHHGRFEKHTCHEEAARVALIARLSGVVPPGTATRSLVQLVDVVPTMLDLCGAGIPPNLQGRSPVPIMADPSAPHGDHVIADYADNAEAMVRTDRWKLIHSSGRCVRRDAYAGDAAPVRSTRLNDLDADPAEARGLADQPANRSVVARLLGLLVDRLIRTEPNPITLPDRGDVRAVLDRCLLPTHPRG